MQHQSNDRRLRYLVCTTARAGSHLLFSLLENAGIAVKGYAEKINPNILKEAEIDWIRKDLRGFMEELFNSIETPDGISGFKIPWEHLEYLACILNGTERCKSVSVSDIKSYFPSDVKYIYLRRRDKVRQAISEVKALQSGIWYIEKDDKRGSAAAVYFDYRSIADRTVDLKRQEKEWGRFFKTNGIRPLGIEYEEYIKDYRGTIVRICEYLSIPLPPRLNVGTDMVKQSDASSEEWVRQYYCMRLWMELWMRMLRFLYRISAWLKERHPFYNQFIEVLKSRSLF